MVIPKVENLAGGAIQPDVDGPSLPIGALEKRAYQVSARDNEYIWPITDSDVKDVALDRGERGPEQDSLDINYVTSFPAVGIRQMMNNK